MFYIYKDVNDLLKIFKKKIKEFVGAEEEHIAIV